MGRSAALVVLVLMIAGCIPYGDAWFQFGGRVVDAGDVPVEGAKLEILVDGALAGHGSIEYSDASGAYRFFEHSCPCDFSFELRVSKLGYEQYSLTLSGRQANALKTHDVVLRRVRNAG